MKGRELLSFISKHKDIGKYILFLFNITQGALELVTIYLILIGLLVGKIHKRNIERCEYNRFLFQMEPMK